MSYTLGQDSVIKKAGAGTVNAIILIGSLLGMYLWMRPKKKKKKGKYRRKHIKQKPVGLPR